jgi:hypothetical protein
MRIQQYYADPDSLTGLKVVVGCSVSDCPDVVLGFVMSWGAEGGGAVHLHLSHPVEEQGFLNFPRWEGGGVPYFPVFVKRMGGWCCKSVIYNTFLKGRCYSFTYTLLNSEMWGSYFLLDCFWNFHGRGFWVLKLSEDSCHPFICNINF